MSICSAKPEFWDVYRATAPLEGRTSYLDKIYISASRKGLKIDVEYIEVFGKDVETGEDRYEKIVP